MANIFLSFQICLIKQHLQQYQAPIISRCWFCNPRVGSSSLAHRIIGARPFPVVWNAHHVISTVTQQECAFILLWRCPKKQTNKFKCSSRKPFAPLWIEWMVQDQEEAFYVAWNAHHVINPDDLLHLREETFLLFFSIVNPITRFQNLIIKLQ